MRALVLIVAAALVAAACSSGSESETDTLGSETTIAGVSAQGAGSASGFCGTVESVIDDLDAIDTDDPDLDVEEMYTLIAKIYRQMNASAPSELNDDLKLLVDMSDRLSEWAKDPTEEFPFTDDEADALDKAGTRVDVFIRDECGIDTDEEIESQIAGDTGDEEVVTGTDKDPENPIGSEDQHHATQIITLGGETYTETLSDMFEVSCDMYGELETGSIGIYLSGPDFESSVSSYDTGIEPGTYEGQIWVFAVDTALDEKTWDLQEIDGAFVLDRAQRITDDEWLFSGSFSATAENDPATSIEATFTCVGPVGY
ncbi:MAG: hypothetical protein M3096_04310 [Actinomycetia bacterium]|nr:hypothetical protein [Actinomycetes bacterium]